MNIDRKLVKFGSDFKTMADVDNFTTRGRGC